MTPEWKVLVNFYPKSGF